MAWDSSFNEMYDDGDAINVANKNRMKSATIAMFGGISDASLDGSLTTFSVCSSSSWHYVDLGEVYRLDNLIIYYGGGVDWSADKIQYSSDDTTTTTPSGLSWTSNAYSVSGVLYTGSDSTTWGPAYTITASGASGEFDARWVRIQPPAGGEVIYELQAIVDHDTTLSGTFYLSTTSGGSCMDKDADSTFLYNLGTVSQGSTASSGTLWMVSTDYDITECSASILYDVGLYTTSANNGNGYYSLQISNDPSSGWYDYTSGKLYLQSTGESAGSIPSGTSAPLYLRWSAPSSASLGQILSRLRILYNSES